MCGPSCTQEYYMKDEDEAKVIIKCEQMLTFSIFLNEHPVSEKMYKKIQMMVKEKKKSECISDTRRA